MATFSEKESNYFKTGDLIIGSRDPGKSVYSATGSKIIDDGVSIYGDTATLVERSEELTASALRSGGKLISSDKNKKQSKKSNKPLSRSSRFQQATQPNKAYSAETEETYEVEPNPEQKSLKTVQFENDFGKIKVKVESIVEHEQAFMLVFENADSMVFEPKTGESLVFYPDNYRTFSVYYPGVTFNWPDNDKMFMILFKMPEENQD